MAGITDEEYRRDTDDVFRAIGRYVVEFSQLTSAMRRVLAWRLSPRRDEFIVGQLAFGEAGASQLANAFFGVCRHVGHPDAKEEKLATSLRKSVNQAIEKRNYLAHGDWVVGDVAEHDAYVEAALLIRYRPLRSQGIQKAERLSADDLDVLSD